MAAAQYIQGCRHSQDNLLEFKMNIRMGKKGDFTEFERSIVVGVHAQPLLEFTVNGQKKGKYPSEH